MPVCFPIKTQSSIMHFSAYGAFSVFGSNEKKKFVLYPFKLLKLDRGRIFK